IAADTLTTNLDDLTRWLLALRQGRIGGVETTAMMAERAVVADGTRAYYGLGLALRRYRGSTVLCHTGSQPGYKAHIAYVPERDLGVVVLSNREDLQPVAITAAILEQAIEERVPRRHPIAAGAFTAEDTSGWEGHYVEPETGEWVALSFEDDVLRGETLGDPF